MFLWAIKMRKAEITDKEDEKGAREQAKRPSFLSSSRSPQHSAFSKHPLHSMKDEVEYENDYKCGPNGIEDNGDDKLPLMQLLMRQSSIGLAEFPFLQLVLMMCMPVYYLLYDGI